MAQLLPLVFLLAVMYFLLIRPQQQRVRQQRAVVTSLEVGDDVVTIGGLLGHIVDIDDDEATIETTPGTRLRFRRTAISTRLDGPSTVADGDEPAEIDDDDEDDDTA